MNNYIDARAVSDVDGRSVSEKLGEVGTQLAQTASGIKPNHSVWQEFEDREVNVRWFGAVGDGVTDDTQAIRNALINSGNKKLYFPKGVYMVDYITTTISGLSVDLVGEVGAVIKAIKNPTNRNYMLRIKTGPEENQTNRAITMKNIVFDGNNAVAQAVRIDNETTTWADKVFAENCTFENILQTPDTNEFSSAGLFVRGAWKVAKAVNCTFRNVDSTKDSQPVTRGFLAANTIGVDSYVKLAVAKDCHFENIRRVEDADGFFSQCGTENPEVLFDTKMIADNCTFIDCEKRWLKSQVGTTIVKGCLFKTDKIEQWGGISPQRGGAIITDNTFVVKRTCDNFIGISNRSGNKNPSVVANNVVKFLDDDLVVDSFVGLTVHGNNENSDSMHGVSIVDNVIDGCLSKFISMAGVGHVDREFCIDGLNIEGNTVKQIVSTFAIFRSREHPWPAFRFKVINNFHMGEAVPAFERETDALIIDVMGWRGNKGIIADNEAEADIIPKKQVDQSDFYGVFHDSRGLSGTSEWVIDLPFRARAARRVTCMIAWSVGTSHTVRLSVLEAWVVYNGNPDNTNTSVHEVYRLDDDGAGIWSIRRNPDSPASIQIVKEAGTHDTSMVAWVEVKGARGL